MRVVEGPEPDATTRREGDVSDLFLRSIRFGGEPLTSMLLRLSTPTTPLAAREWLQRPLSGRELNAA